MRSTTTSLAGIAAIAIGAATMVALRREIFPLVEINHVHGSHIQDAVPSPATDDAGLDITLLFALGLVVACILGFFLVGIFVVPAPWSTVDVATYVGMHWSSGGSIPSR